MRTHFPERGGIVEAVRFVCPSEFRCFAFYRELLDLQVVSLVFIFLWASFYPLGAQPLSEYRYGRIVTHSKENQYWFVFQDRQGFIWGYDKDYHVVKFDGHEARVFSHDPSDTTSLQCEGYPVFLEDSEGKIWIAIGSCGLERYDPVTEKFQHFGEAVYAAFDGSPRSYHLLFEDSRKDIWIGTQAGVFHFARREGSMKYASAVWHCISILEDREGLIWAGNPTYNKIIRQIDPASTSKGKQVNFPIVKPIPNKASRNMNGETLPLRVPTHKDRHLIRDDGHLFVYDIGLEQITEVRAGLMEGEWASFIFQDEGFTLVGTNNGRILEFDPVSNTCVPFLDLPGQSGPTDPILRMFRGRDGIFWVVTKNKTYQVLPIKSPFYKKTFPPDIRPQTSSGHPDMLVPYKGNIHFHVMDGLRPVLENRPGAKPLLLDFDDRDFDVLEEIREQFHRVGEPSLISGFKYAEDTVHKKLWLLLYQYPMGMKLISYDEQGKKTFNLFCQGRDTCFVDHFMDFKIDSKGRLMMAGWAGFSLYDPATGKFLNLKRKEKFNDFATLRALEDSKNQIWIGNNNRGVIRFRPETGQFAHYTHSRANASTLSTNYRVGDIVEDKAGHLWFATLSGLNRMDPNTGAVQRFFEKDGLPSNMVLTLIEDKNQHLWIATKYSLTRYNPAEEAFYIFEGRDGLPLEDHAENGLVDRPTSVVFRENGALMDHRDFLFFETSDGVVYFHPDSVAIDKTVPKLVFTSLQLANEPVKTGDSSAILSKSITCTDALTLKHRQNVFSIRYAALEFLFPDKTAYAFQLEGFDPDWRQVGSIREATYTNLPPGSYLFKVKCRNHHGFWGEPILLQITIRPPWYRTWLAYLIYVLTGGALLFGIRHYELRRQLARAEARRLHELDQVKNRFYTNITHEFRTPLTVINGMADRLQGQVDFAAREGLRLIRRNGRHLLGLVNQILDLAKLESGSLPVNLAQGDVTVFLKYLLESFRSLADDKYITLHFTSAHSSFQMDFDAEKMRQIIGNLLHNAIKFTPEKGRVEVKASVAGERFRIEVADNGRGIPPDQLDKIFDRFHQVDGSATRSGEGTGIGLTLTRELVKLLGGEISVESAEGQGSTFTVLLPVSRKAAAVRPGILQQPDLASFQNLSDEKPAVPKTGRAKIENLSAQKPVLLIIEDNPDVVQYITLVLQNSYQLLTAANGKLGLETARAEVPDLILSDVMMPGMDGYEVCRRLKSDRTTSHIPVVMLTAKADFDSRMEGLEGGAEAYLSKPFEERELTTVLRKLLDNRELLRRHYTSGQFIGGSTRPVGTQSANRPGAKAPSRDEQFLQEVLSVVETHLNDTDLTAEGLAALLHVTYNNLFKKTKALTGMGVTEYVRHIRLHKAARLLVERKELPVSQVALDVGFNHPGFFSREFKKVMGATPKQYRERG